MSWFRSQQAYTVHEPPEPPADRDERAEQLRFVREGFSLFAFVVPPLWMLANRLWPVLIGYVVLGALIHGGIVLFGIPEHWHYWAMLALNFVAGFEADALERWTLDRRGWRMIGSVSGSSFEACERRFFESWVPTVAYVNPNNFAKPGDFNATTERPELPRQGDVMPPRHSSWRSDAGWLRRRGPAT